MLNPKEAEMDIQAGLAGETGFVAMDGELTIYAVAEWKQALSDAFMGCARLDIDLTSVTEIDSAGVQLLVAAKRYAAAIGKPMRLVGLSAPVAEMLELCRLGNFFGDPVTGAMP